LESHGRGADVGRNRYDGCMLVMTLLDDSARPEHVLRLRSQVAAGVYRPPDDAVAERLLAWLSLPDGWLSA